MKLLTRLLVVVMMMSWLCQDLSDDYIKNPAQEFPPGRLVAARVLAVGADGRSGIDLSLKASAVVGEFVHKVNFETLREGMKVGQ